jgi:pyridoxal 5'-phosphate synthase pdxS subunit
MMQLGAETVFVGSGIFKSADPGIRAKAIVEAVANYKNPARLAEISTGLGEAIPGVDVRQLNDNQKLALRGW